ncbi:MAG: hypothetical protein K8E24_015040, partial [Methanobacterium paludis]|nr:hypothetical protein [Methanobacterium paludis]
PGGEDISYEPAAAAASVEFGDFVIRRLASGTIEVDKDGVSVEPVMPVLRTLAAELNVSLRSSTGTDLNTQNLGVRVMAAIRGMGAASGPPHCQALTWVDRYCPCCWSLLIRHS